jgi:hypothetical protein
MAASSSSEQQQLLQQEEELLTVTCPATQMKPPTPVIQNIPIYVTYALCPASYLYSRQSLKGHSHEKVFQIIPLNQCCESGIRIRDGAMVGSGIRDKTSRLRNTALNHRLGPN